MSTGGEVGSERKGPRRVKVIRRPAAGAERAFERTVRVLRRLFNGSREGLAFGRVTDDRFDAQQKDRDRDGGPLTHIFSARDKADLQRIARLGLKKFVTLETLPR